MNRELQERVWAQVDEKALAQLTADLVDFPSITGEEKGIAEFLYTHLRALGLETTLQEFEAERFNVLATLRGDGSGPSLMFNGHMDISFSGQEDYLPNVPGYQPKALVEDGWIYGMGSHNMKGALACYVAAVEAVIRAGAALRGDVLLALVGGEIERHSVGRYQGRQFRGGGGGTRYLVTNGGTADMPVIGEPTRMRVVPEHVGSVAVRLTTRGLPAPLRVADHGMDAVRAMRPLLDVFDDFAAEYSRRHRYRNLPGTIHLACIEGGWPWRCNRVPIFCSAYVEVRILPDQTMQDVRREIQALIARARDKDSTFKVEVEFYVTNPGATTDRKSWVSRAVQRAHTAVHGAPPEVITGAFTSDAIHLTRYGIPTINYGPAGRTRSGKEMWDPLLGEHIAVADLVTCTKVYAATILEVCTRARDEVLGANAGQAA